MYFPRVTVPLRCVVFDYGGVLYTYNYQDSLRIFSREPKISYEQAEASWSSRIEEFERGEISEAEY